MKPARIDNQACPCGSGTLFSSCCAPYHRATKHPLTAEQLMRSRYSAFVVNDLDYLAHSWHPSTRPASISPNEAGLLWQGLEIISTHAGQPNDEKGEVEFIAHYTLNGQPQQLHERSRFKRVDGHWSYLDGEHPAPQIKRNQKTGRNEACPCGSGKKYKRCCMQS